MALDLAQGRLDDLAAAEADEVRLSCPQCRAWWSDNLEGEAAASVDREIAAVFSSFQIPRRRRISPWLAAAAAVLLACGALVLMQGLGPSTPSAGLVASGSGQPPQPLAEESALFVDNLESGELDGWVLEAGEPSARAANAQAETEALFVSGMESGDLSSWSSS